LVLDANKDYLVYDWQESVVESSLVRRFGSIALDIGIFIFTLGIGWLVWQLFLLNRAQSPAKQLLNLRVEQLETNTQLSIPTYLIRLISLPLAIGAVVLVSFLGLSLTGRVVSEAWLLAFSQVVSIILTLVDFGGLFSARKSRITDRVLRTKLVFGMSVPG
jgi:uncharacterized RDD family membrane protein YckC